MLVAAQKPKPHVTAWMPVPYSEKEMRLIQALASGEANKEEQQAALRFIIETVSGYYDMSYRPESDRDTCFAEGRRFVGATLVKLLKLTPKNFNHPKKG